MPSSSTPGFGLQDAVESLRETFASFGTRSKRVDDREDDGQERRDIRHAILFELKNEPMHGHQIIRAIEDQSGGHWKPAPGLVYPTLQVLVDEELVVAKQIGERKFYSLTEAGRGAASEPAGPEQPGENREHDGQGLQGLVTLTGAGMKLAQALTQVAQNGTPDQSRRVVALVDEARRKVYAILAED